MRKNLFPSPSVRCLLFQSWGVIALSVVGLVMLTAGLLFAHPLFQAVHAARPANAGDWPMYMYNSGRSGYNRAETIINQRSAPHLKVHWTAQAGGHIFAQSVEANG